MSNQNVMLGKWCTIETLEYIGHKVKKVKKELRRSSQNQEEVMAGIGGMEEEDMIDEEEAGLPAITMVRKGIWLEILDAF